MQVTFHSSPSTHIEFVAFSILKISGILIFVSQADSIEEAIAIVNLNKYVKVSTIDLNFYSGFLWKLISIV